MFIHISSPCPQVSRVTHRVLRECQHTQLTVLQEGNTEFEALTVFIISEKKPVLCSVGDIISLLKASHCTHIPEKLPR